MNALFQGLRHGEIFRGKSSDEFLTCIARFLGELNAIHPFREGNGRSQLAFVGLIGSTVGHQFAFERLDRKTFLAAMIASYWGKLDPLLAELKHLLVSPD